MVKADIYYDLLRPQSMFFQHYLRWGRLPLCLWLDSTRANAANHSIEILNNLYLVKQARRPFGRGWALVVETTRKVYPNELMKNFA